MNISSHTFVPTSSYITSSGNYLSKWNYYFISSQFGRVFPFDGDVYSYRVSPSSPLLSFNSTNKVPLLIYQISDIRDPKKFVFLIY